MSAIDSDFKNKLPRSCGSDASACSSYVELWSKPADGKRYKRIEGSRRLVSDFKMHPSTVATTLEREMNGGFTADEAEIAFPRLGQHSRTVTKVRIICKMANSESWTF